MELTTTYKKVLAVLILFLAGLCASAQQNVVVNSVRAFKVPKNAITNHSYQWEVYRGTEINEATRVKLNEVSGEYEVGLVGKDAIVSQEPKIRWRSPFVKIGDIYTVVLTEINDISGCNREVSTTINIVDTPISVDFGDPKGDYKVVDLNREKFTVPFEFTINGNELWKQSMLTKSFERKFKVKFKVTYHSESGSEVIPIEKELGGNSFEFVYDIDKSFFREDNLSDHYFEFEITEVKDAYDADVKFPADTRYIFGAYKKPGVTKINHKK